MNVFIISKAANLVAALPLCIAIKLSVALIKNGFFINVLNSREWSSRVRA